MQEIKQKSRQLLGIDKLKVFNDVDQPVKIEKLTVFQKYQYNNNKLRKNSAQVAKKPTEDINLKLIISKPVVRSDYYNLVISPSSQRFKNHTFMTSFQQSFKCNIEHQNSGIIKNTITNSQLPGNCNFIAFRDFAVSNKSSMNKSLKELKHESRKQDREFLEKISAPINSRQMNKTFNNFHKNKGLYKIKEGSHLKVSKEAHKSTLLPVSLVKSNSKPKELTRYKNTSVDLDNPMNNHLLKMQWVKSNFTRLKLSKTSRLLNSKSQTARMKTDKETSLTKEEVRLKVEDFNNLSKVLNDSIDSVMSISSGGSFLKTSLCHNNAFNWKANPIRKEKEKAPLSKTAVTTSNGSLERMREITTAKMERRKTFRKIQEDNTSKIKKLRILTSRNKTDKSHTQKDKKLKIALSSITNKPNVYSMFKAPGHTFLTNYSSNHKPS